MKCHTIVTYIRFQWVRIAYIFTKSVCLNRAYVVSEYLILSLIFWSLFKHEIVVPSHEQCIFTESSNYYCENKICTKYVGSN